MKINNVIAKFWKLTSRFLKSDNWEDVIIALEISESLQMGYSAQRYIKLLVQEPKDVHVTGSFETHQKYANLKFLDYMRRILIPVDPDSLFV